MGERRGHRMRRVRALAAVTLGALALSGCSLIGDGQVVWGILADEAGKQAVLSEAIDELGELPGVEHVRSRFLPDGPRGDEAGLEVVAEAGATDQQLVTIADSTYDLLSADELSGTMRTLDLQTADGGKFSSDNFDLGAPELADEAEFWVAAQRAIDAPLWMKVSTLGGGEYLREVWPGLDGDSLEVTDKLIANHAAVNDVPEPRGATTLWLLPGFDAQSMPLSADAIGLLADIRSEMPLLDYSNLPEEVTVDYEFPEGATVRWRAMWTDGPLEARVIVNMNEYRESDWDAVVRVAALTAAAPGFSFSYQVTDAIGNYQEFRFTAPCDGHVDSTDDDRLLVAALAEIGTVLAEGAGPGICSPAREG